jgi:hypothetical protein
LADECHGEPQEQYGTNQVFVGGVHGQVTASMLAQIMATEFGPVRFTRLHTDQHLYPNGVFTECTHTSNRVVCAASGLVQFVSHDSFALAVARRALTITTNRFANKRLQIDPYLHEYAVDCFECRRTCAYGMCRACLVHLCDECFAVRFVRSSPGASTVFAAALHRLQSFAGNENGYKAPPLDLLNMGAHMLFVVFALFDIRVFARCSWQMWLVTLHFLAGVACKFVSRLVC